jgi:hypothetical protein
MAITTISANDRIYRFSADDEPPRASRYWMLVRARLVNDVTLRPVTDSVRVESDLSPAIPRIADDGVVGLVAVPKDIFPTLIARGFTFNLTFHARGFLSQTVAVIISAVQKTMAAPLPAIGDFIVTLNDTTNLQVGEFLWIGAGSLANGIYEDVRIAALGPGPNQVMVRPTVSMSHNLAENVFAVVPSNFTPIDLGDVLMVPA